VAENVGILSANPTLDAFERVRLQRGVIDGQTQIVVRCMWQRVGWMLRLSSRSGAMAVQRRWFVWPFSETRRYVAARSIVEQILMTRAFIA
jgi:hypothetical protein